MIIVIVCLIVCLPIITFIVKYFVVKNNVELFLRKYFQAIIKIKRLKLNIV